MFLCHTDIASSSVTPTKFSPSYSLPNEGNIYVGSSQETYVLENLVIPDDINLLVLSTCHSYSNAITTRLSLKCISAHLVHPCRSV
jgi:hypothetical protein